MCSMKKTFDEVVLFARTGLNPRQNFKLGQGNNAYITIKNIKNNSLIVDENTDVVDDEAIKLIHKRSQIKKGDILFASIGIMGDMYIIEEEPTDWDINESVFAFTLDTSIVRQKYFYYIFRVKSTMDYLASNSSGSTFKSIKMNQLKKMVFDIPSLEEQDQIIKLLDKVCNVIEMRKQELSALDNLIKARFVEMFGDARENPNGYTTVPFIDIIEYMGDIGSNGANKVVVDHLHMKDEEDYAMMVRFTNFTKNDFIDDVKYVSKEAYDFFKKSQIFGGELIICKIGSAGQNYVMPYLNRPVSLGLNQIMVRINENILMPYLYQYLHTDYGEFLISGCINGAVTKTITKTELKKIPVMLPPMELQNEFAEFIKQVDKSKVVFYIHKNNCKEEAQ